MTVRLLKNDLKKNRVMNVILLIFITMASMFMASGLNNVMAVANGTDRYFDLAGIGDYIVLSKAGGNEHELTGILDRTKEITGYRTEDGAVISGKKIQDAEGRELEICSTVLLTSASRCSVSLFDREDRKIQEVKKGHAYISGSVVENSGLEPGDEIRIILGDRTVPLILDGKMKDALFGSDLIGTTRILVSEEDYREHFSEEMGEKIDSRLYYIDTENIPAVEAALSAADNLIFNEGRTTLRLCYVLDLIAAMVILIASLCMVIVSFVMLKFSIGFHIMEESREIGVMKALGIGSRRIRFLYLAKYLVLSVAGALVGFGLSIPFGKMLMRSVSENMVLGNSGGLLFYILGSLIVVTATVWFASFCSGRINKAAPLDAIRSGQTGERFERKRGIRLNKCRLGSISFLAVNDILSSPKRYLSMIVTFCLCTLLVLVLENTAATMNSDRLIGTFASKADLYLMNTDDMMETFTNNMSVERQCADIGQKLEQEGLPARVSTELMYKYPVTFEGVTYTLTGLQGLNTEMDVYEATEGYVPAHKEEIMITEQISELTGAKIGDTVTVHFPSGDMDCLVSGYFSSLCLLGKVIRFHNDAPVDQDHLSGMMAYQIQFTDHDRTEDLPDSVLLERKERIKELFESEVFTAAEYCVEITVAFGTVESLKHLLFGITFIVIFLVTALMERTFISDEKPQIALLKAVGFSDRRVVLWHGFRLAAVGMIAAVLAALLSVPATKLCISSLFKMMGATKVNYMIRPWKVFIAYPLCIFLFTLAAGLLQALGTQKIRCRDAAAME